MGHYSQLYLRVVRTEKYVARFRNKRFPNLASVFPAHRNILQVRVARRQAPRRRNRLIKRRVQVSRLRIHEFGQGFHIRAQQLLESAMRQYLPDNFMLVREAHEHFFRRRVLAALRLFRLLVNFKFAEKHLAHLFRRGNHKRVARQLIYFRLQLDHTRRKLAADLLQGIGVEANPVALHPSQDRHQRHLNIIEDLFDPVLAHRFFERRHQSQRDVSVFAGVLKYVFRVQISHIALPASLRPDQLFDRNRTIVEIDARQVVHVVRQFRLHNIMGQHRVEKSALRFHTIRSQHREIVFQILPNNQNVRLFPKWAKEFQARFDRIRFT